MADNARSLSRRSRLAYGIGCLALGCYPVALALGLLPLDDAEFAAPRWVLAGAGLVFIVSGFMILLANHTRANDLLAGVLLLLFTALGSWVALFGPDEGFSGGLPFLPAEQNVVLGRVLFGFGAMISLAVSVYAFRRASAQNNKRPT